MKTLILLFTILMTVSSSPRFMEEEESLIRRERDPWPIFDGSDLKWRAIKAKLDCQFIWYSFVRDINVGKRKWCDSDFPMAAENKGRLSYKRCIPVWAKDATLVEASSFKTQECGFCRSAWNPVKASIYNIKDQHDLMDWCKDALCEQIVHSASISGAQDVFEYLSQCETDNKIIIKKYEELCSWCGANYEPDAPIEQKILNGQRYDANAVVEQEGMGNVW